MKVVVRMVSGDEIVLSSPFNKIQDYSKALINAEAQNTVSFWSVNGKVVAIYSPNIESIKEV